MRTITTKVYGVRHLKRYYPAGFQRAHEKYCESVREDTDRMDEIVGSLKDLFKAAGVQMSDWSIGAYSQSYIRADFGGSYGDETGELSGARAFAWIENNLLAQYRAPWGLPKIDHRRKELPEGFTRAWEAPNKKHPHGCLHSDSARPISRWTRPGAVKECPFSGMCYDVDFLEKLQKAIKDGDTLKEAFEGLASDASRMIEDEYQQKEESFIETAEANEWEYTADGEQIR